MAENRNEDEGQVLALDDQERAAALTRDVPALERLWSADLTINAPNSQVVVGRQAVLDMFVHAGIIDFSAFEREVEFIRADGPLEREDGTWRLFARHANVITGRGGK